MISAFVITCDDEPAILKATLAAVRWVDDLVLIDKSKKRSTPPYMVSKVDRYFEIPWSPTVEETRSYALSQTTRDWVVCLDADEILSPQCEAVFRGFTVAKTADVLMVPIKHHNLGRHDQRALYWPEWRPTLARCGAIEYGPVVHAGNRIVGSVTTLPAEGDAFITHLSNPDVATYVEKANRYTSRPQRTGVGVPPPGMLREWAVDSLQRYEGRAGWGTDDYNDAVALLRGLYDLVDGLKRWEATQPPGREVFLEIAAAEAER